MYGFSERLDVPISRTIIYNFCQLVMPAELIKVEVAIRIYSPRPRRMACEQFPHDHFRECKLGWGGNLSVCFSTK